MTGKEHDEGVELRIRDNGCGISDKARSNMFEPFYTTKSRGRGMGLGLSICRRILEDHGATIRVESCKGEFTEFTLSFPSVYNEESMEDRAGTRPESAAVDYPS